MTVKKVSNLAASVHARLQSHARATKRPFQELLQYYAMERFLYRLSTSPHRARFVLKGALMLHPPADRARLRSRRELRTALGAGRAVDERRLRKESAQSARVSVPTVPGGSECTLMTIHRCDAYAQSFPVEGTLSPSFR